MERDDEFGAYVLQHRARLFRTAWLLCGDPHLAEDLVQEALTRYVAWPRARRSDSIDAYVRRTLVNGHIDASRRPWRRERPLAALPDAPSVLESGEGDDDLWAALRALPPGQRRVVVLRHYWALSVEETAADLGLSAGTVKSQTADALKALRQRLATSDPGSPHHAAAAVRSSEGGTQ